MNIFDLLKKYGSHEQCVQLLERVRWRDKPSCPYYQSTKVGRHKEKNRKSRWQCSSCQKSYSVTAGTMFHYNHMDLSVWFAILNTILNAKKSISSYQLSRELEEDSPRCFASKIGYARLCQVRKSSY